MENALYLGMLPLLLALSAPGALRRKPVWIFIALSGGSLLVACGTPLLDLFYHLLPGFNVGNPKRILVLHTFALAACAALGWERFMQSPQRRPSRILTGFYLGLGLLGGLLLLVDCAPLKDFLGAWWADRAAACGQAPPSSEELQAVMAYLSRIGRLPVLALLLFGFIRVIPWARFKLRSVPVLLILVFTAVELWVFCFGFWTTQEAGYQYPATQTSDFLTRSQEGSMPFRVVSFGDSRVLPPSASALHGIHFLGGWTALMHRRYGAYCHALDPGLIRMQDPRVVGALKTLERLPSPMLNLLGVRYIACGGLKQAALLKSRGFTPVFQNRKEGIVLVENRSALPRSFVVTACTVTGNGRSNHEQAREDALTRIASPGFVPREEVILEAPAPDGFSPRPDPEGRSPVVSMELYQPLEIRFHVRMHAARGFLLLIDTYFPGWKAYVDDKPAPILLADYAFRAVPLDEGDHRVVFRYEPDSRWLGMTVTFLSLAIALAWGLVLVFINRRSGGGSGGSGRVRDREDHQPA